jgi:hypothetical protein
VEKGRAVLRIAAGERAATATVGLKRAALVAMGATRVVRRFMFQLKKQQLFSVQTFFWSLSFTKIRQPSIEDGHLHDKKTTTLLYNVEKLKLHNR